MTKQKMPAMAILSCRNDWRAIRMGLWRISSSSCGMPPITMRCAALLMVERRGALFFLLAMRFPP